MQPVVPERGLPNVVAPNRSQPLRVAVEISEDPTNIGRIEWHVNYRIRPVKLPFEFFGTRRLADHHRPRCGTFVEPRRELITARRELRLVDIAAIGEVVAGGLGYFRGHAAGVLRGIAPKRALLWVGAPPRPRVRVIEKGFLPFRFP